MGENGRKWLGKQSKCSKLVKKSSELSQNVPKCPKMSQNVSKCPKMPTSDASLSERTCFLIWRHWWKNGWKTAKNEKHVIFELFPGSYGYTNLSFFISGGLKIVLHVCYRQGNEGKLFSTLQSNSSSPIDATVAWWLARRSMEIECVVETEFTFMSRNSNF